MRHFNLRVIAVLFAVALSGAVVAGCGGGDDGGGSGSEDANAADQAFVRMMVPHHESAVEMAEIAQEKSRRKEIKTLADNIVKTQTAEIEELNTIAESIGAEPEMSGEMSGMDHGGDSGGDSAADLEALGLSAEEAGMSMDSMELEDAKPFDRAFIDMMVAHHRGAIAMAEAVLERGKNPDVKAIAEKIVSAQEKEIKDMNSWRTDWYGSPVPDDGS